MSEIKVNSIKGVGASAAAITVNNTDGTCTANITNNLSNRNLIINGAMQVAQRGTSTTTNGYLIDRFRSNLGGMDQLAFTMSQSTDAPSGFRKSLKFDVTTAETGGVAADEYAGIRYITESQDVAHLLYGTSGAKTITLSFHVKAYQTGTYALNLFMGDTSRAYTTTYTISQSATWEKKTLTFVGDTGGSEINVDNGHGLYINWFFAAGSTFNSSSANTNQWAGYTNAGWANGQGVDLTNSTDNYFQLTGVQLEVDHTGSGVATDFEHRSFAQELLLCQRYYRVLSDSGQDGIGYLGLMSYNYDVNSVVTQVNFIPEMRATPSADSTVGTNYYRYYRNSGYVDINSMSVLNGMGRKGGAFNNADSGNGTAGQAGGIVLNNSSAKIAFNAEL